MTFRWNTKDMVKLLKDNVPYDVVVAAHGAGGDFDSDEILIYPKSAKQNPRDFLKCVRLQAWLEEMSMDGLTDAQRHDHDGYEYISVNDGTSESPCMSRDPDIIQMYADVLKILRQHMPTVHIIGHYKEIY